MCFLSNKTFAQSSLSQYVSPWKLKMLLHMELLVCVYRIVFLLWHCFKTFYGKQFINWMKWTHFNPITDFYFSSNICKGRILVQVKQEDIQSIAVQTESTSRKHTITSHWTSLYGKTHNSLWTKLPPSAGVSLSLAIAPGSHISSFKRYTEDSIGDLILPNFKILHGDRMRNTYHKSYNITLPS